MLYLRCGSKPEGRESPQDASSPVGECRTSIPTARCIDPRSSPSPGRVFPSYFCPPLLS